MSIQMHPTISHYIAAGFYNGSVGIFSLLNPKPNEAKLISRGNHSDAVWQVYI